MLKEAGPSSKELTDAKAYEDFLSREGGCVVGKHQTKLDVLDIYILSASTAGHTGRETIVFCFCDAQLLTVVFHTMESLKMSMLTNRQKEH